MKYLQLLTSLKSHANQLNNVFMKYVHLYMKMIADNSYGNELSLMSVKSNVQRGLTGKSIDNYTP